MTVYRFIRPVDVLFLRGNRLFGAAGGDHAEPLMPPWPSLVAGALRSQMLAAAGVPLGAFTDETTESPLRSPLREVLGTPATPGTFRVTFVGLGRRASNEILVPLPSDLVVTSAAAEGEAAEQVARLRVTPREALGAVASSCELPALPVLRSAAAAKPKAGYWLTGAGLWTYLEGATPSLDQLVHQRDLWQTDPRLGIALDRGARTVERGKLYTSDAVALVEGVGFVVGVDGCPDELLPGDGLLRLGGDGRGAEVSPWPHPERTAGLQARPENAAARVDTPFTLVLSTPGIFPGGWLPPGIDPQTRLLHCDGLEARLASAAVPRHEVVSGWDVAAHRPKPAQRAVPAGAVYFFDQVRGDPNAYPQGLWGLVATQLGDPFPTTWKQRRAEGFTNVWVGRWPGGGA